MTVIVWIAINQSRLFLPWNYSTCMRKQLPYLRCLDFGFRSILVIEVLLHSKAGAAGSAVVGAVMRKLKKWSDLKEEASIFVLEVCSSGLFKTPAPTRSCPLGFLRHEFRIMGLPPAAKEAPGCVGGCSVACRTLAPGSGLDRWLKEKWFQLQIDSDKQHSGAFRPLALPCWDNGHLHNVGF